MIIYIFIWKLKASNDLIGEELTKVKCVT